MPAGLSEFAEVAVPVAVHGTFTYAIPPDLRDAVRLGSRVEVPFGAKRNTGFVVGLSDAALEGSRIKPIRAVLDDDEPALLPEIIELCRWAAEYYLAPLGEMLRVALPANMSASGRREVTLVGEERDRAHRTPRAAAYARRVYRGTRSGKRWRDSAFGRTDVGDRDDSKIARHVRAVSSRRRYRKRQDRGLHRIDARRGEARGA